MAKWLEQNPKIDKRRLFLIGRSLGGSVALHLLAEEKYADLFRGAVIENTWTSFTEVADQLFALFQIFPFLKKLILTIKWDNLQVI